MSLTYTTSQGQTETPLLDEVCRLCRNTGYSPGKPRPAGYPESFFERFPLPKHVLHMIVGRLRSDDIYNQVRARTRTRTRTLAP